jgi:hypothetical protein
MRHFKIGTGRIPKNAFRCHGRVAACFGFVAFLFGALAACGKEPRENGPKLLVRTTLHRQADGAATPAAANKDGTPKIDEKKVIESYKATLHPVLSTNCSACHASRVAPYFAAQDPVQSYLAITQAKKVDFVTPSNSRVVQRLAIEGHNCWSNCAENSKDILAALTKWVADAGLNQVSTKNYAFVTPEVTKPDMFVAFDADAAASDDAQGEQNPLVEVVVEAESLTIPQGWRVAEEPATAGSKEPLRYVTADGGDNTLTVTEVETAPAVPEFVVVFFVPQDAAYSLYMKASGPTNNSNEFFFKINDDTMWRVGKVQAGGMSVYNHIANRTWTAGAHILRIRQKSSQLRIDKFSAITRRPNSGSILTNLEGLQEKPSPLANRFLEFDVSGATKIAGSKLILAAAAYTEKTYLFTRPFLLIPGAGKTFRVRGLVPLINGVHSPQHTGWLGVDSSLASPGDVVTATALTLIADKGRKDDKFSFAFQSFEAVDPTTISSNP